jgi:hypothetical protein
VGEVGGVADARGLVPAAGIDFAAIPSARRIEFRDHVTYQVALPHRLTVRLEGPA